MLRQNLMDPVLLKTVIDDMERDCNLKFDEIYHVLNYLMSPSGQRAIIKGYQQ